MTARTAALLLFLALAACKKEPGPQSLVEDAEAPGLYALAADTMTVWKRARQPDGLWLFQSWSITPGGTVEYLEEQERGGTPANPEDVRVLSEKRHGFTLPPADFQAIRVEAALLRPAAMGPRDPVRGYRGEVHAKGCKPDAGQPRVAGINFLNDASWGAFILQPGCDSQGARGATAAMNLVFDRLQSAGRASPQR